MTDRYAKYRTVETDERKRKYIGWIEELSLNAWPSHKIELYDGWLLRFSHNYTHRTNSVQQVGESKIPLDEKIRYCESVYHAMHTPCIFKLSPLTDTSFDQLPASSTEFANKEFTADEWSENEVWSSQEQMLLSLVPSQGIDVNKVLSSWLEFKFNVPPDYIPNKHVFILRLADGTYAALQLANFVSPEGKKCFLTINYKYPY